MVLNILTECFFLHPTTFLFFPLLGIALVCDAEEAEPAGEAPCEEEQRQDECCQAEGGLYQSSAAEPSLRGATPQVDACPF